MSIARIGVKYIAVIWLVVILTVGSAIFAGYHRNREDLISLLQNEAERLITMVTIAAESSIHALDEVEIITAERLIDNAHHIERITRTHIPTRQELAEIANENDLFNISILAKDGTIIVRSMEPENQDHRGNSGHRPEVMDVLSGKAQSRIIGFMDNSYSAESRYGVVVGGEKVGAVVVNIDSAEMLDFRKTVGLGTMFRDMGRDDKIRYIALQDTIGIIAASPGITQMTSIEDDKFLSKAVSEERMSRFIEVNDEHILEIAAPLIVDDYKLGLIRIGLETLTLREISGRSLRHFTMLFAIAVASAAFLFMYTILRQNYTLLNHEHDRILGDVRRMEEENRRTERLTSMGRLAAGVAHEIRNPLNSISMLVQLLGTEFEVRENADRYKGFIGSITKEIDRIGVIVENFLTYARPRKLEKRKVALTTIADDVLAIVSERAKGFHIEISADIDPGIDCFCDIDQMKQVFLNLILNAIDAVDENGNIGISARKNDGQIILEISDSGGGISDEIISSIFDPYFTTKESGSGLGLSEVHRIVSMHGGTVHAGNGDAGAVFTVILPTNGKNDGGKNSHSG